MDTGSEICDPWRVNSEPGSKASGHPNFCLLLNSPELCPASAFRVLRKICQTMDLKYPSILVQAVSLKNGNFGQCYEAYCTVNTLMCVALGKSAESACNGACLRMAIHLMGYVTMQNLQDLENMSEQDGDISTEDISMLGGVMEFANLEDFCEDVNAEEAIEFQNEEEAGSSCKPIEVGKAGSTLLQMLVNSDGKGDHGAGLVSADQDQEKPGLSTQRDEALEKGSARHVSVGSDYVSALKHYCDKHGLKPDYIFIYVDDPWYRHFVAELTVTSDDIPVEHLRVKGHGRNKRTAKHAAAKEMLRMLGEPVND